jgi:hypothetical protein
MSFGQIKDEAVRYGQAAYNGYCESSGNKSLVTDATLPPWDELSDAIKVAWVHSAMRAREAE